MYDITEQKEAEERTQDAKNRYRTMVERVPAVAYLWDSADAPGDVAPPYISPQIERLLGFTDTEWREDPAMWNDRRKLARAPLHHVVAHQPDRGRTRRRTDRRGGRTWDRSSRCAGLHSSGTRRNGEAPNA